MNISSRDIILLAHAAFGITGSTAALWVFIETLNARPGNAAFLPIATREKPYSNPAARKLVLSIAAQILITGFAVEGAGAIINYGVKVALLRGISKGTPQ